AAVGGLLLHAARGGCGAAARPQMTPRRRPYYHDAEALELIVEHLADWILVEDDHLTAEHQMEKWEAKEEVEQAAGLAAARDGNYRPLIRGWLEERRWDLSEEAEQLIAQRLTGAAKRSHRRGPAHGTYSRSREVAKWVPVIREILHVFYPAVPERE